jgi:hypothetical protein
LKAAREQLEKSIAETSEVAKQLEHWEREHTDVKKLVDELRRNVADLPPAMAADDAVLTNRLQVRNVLTIDRNVSLLNCHSITLFPYVFDFFKYDAVKTCYCELQLVRDDLDMVTSRINALNRITNSVLPRIDQPTLVRLMSSEGALHAQVIGLHQAIDRLDREMHMAQAWHGRYKADFDVVKNFIEQVRLK